MKHSIFYHILQIVSCIIDPLLQEVNETASRLPTVDMAVYLLNCMHQIHSTLALYEYMDQRLERLQVQYIFNNISKIVLQNK